MQNHRLNSFESQCLHENRKKNERKRYLFAGIALLLSLFSFVLQTETAGYLSFKLKYHKPIFMLLLTHSCWIICAPIQFFILFLTKYINKNKINNNSNNNLNFNILNDIKNFFYSHKKNILTTLSLIANKNNFQKDFKITSLKPIEWYNFKSLLKYLFKTILKLTFALTLAGSSWYISINLTTTSDLTAIYNSSAFFAYAFSIPLLHEKFRWDKILSVIVAIIGVCIVAYSGNNDFDNNNNNNNNTNNPSQRSLGNLIIGFGAVLYGLYEVLYKKLACPPNNYISTHEQSIFANFIASCIGLCTFSFAWIIIIIFHITGIEIFQFPNSEEWSMIIASLFGNVLFSSSFLILMSLTSPVFSSVSSLLTIFLVTLTDWALFNTPISFNAIIGGFLIIIAFIVLSYASWKEIVGEDDNDFNDNIDDNYNENEPILSDDIEHRSFLN